MLPFAESVEKSRLLCELNFPAGDERGLQTKRRYLSLLSLSSFSANKNRLIISIIVHPYLHVSCNLWL